MINLKLFSNDVVLSKITPQIFVVNFRDKYNLCMTFLRYQEYYESPIKSIRKQNFTIFEFMEVYSKKFGNGAFTYAKDWCGFNIPINLIKEVFSNGIRDRNKYDDLIQSIIEEIDKNSDPNADNYLIGTVGKDYSILKHEFAHALFHTNKEYKNEMLSLIKDLPEDYIKSLHKALKKWGYTKSVYNDEIQAYLSTFVNNPNNPDDLDLKSIYKPFRKVFKKFSNK